MRGIEKTFAEGYSIFETISVESVKNRRKRLMASKVVITGRGLITPLGAGLAANLEALKNTKSGVSFSQEFHENQLETQVAGLVNYEYDCPMFERKALRFMPKNAKMAVAAAYEAVCEAGFTPETLPGDRMAVINGCAGSAYGELHPSLCRFEEHRSVRKISPFSVPRVMPSSAAANLALVYHITGESYDISCACTSSALTIMAAARLIQSGEYDMVMAGGSEEVCWEQALGFNAMKALSHNYNSCPEKASRPFDKDRDGFVIAEGAGILILESEDHAKARGANILCELTGYASNNNATDMVVPDAAASAKVMSMAISRAGLTPDDISYINTHGTSTTIGDLVELQAIQKVFGSAGKVAINSTKSQTGHMIGAAGAVEAIYTTLSIQHSFIGKSANMENVEPGFEWADIVRETRTETEIRHALSNSFAFGGTNTSLVLSRYEV